MNPRQFTQMMKAGCRVLDKVGKSIFMANVARIIDGDESYIFITAEVKAVVISAGGGQEEVKKEVEGLVNYLSVRAQKTFWSFDVWSSYLFFGLGA